MRRVVITGTGAVTPFGFGVHTLWNSLLKNKNGITKINDINLQGDIVKIGGCLPKADYSKYLREDEELFSYIPEDESNKSFFIAVYEALKEAALDPRKLNSTDNIAVCIADRNTGYINYIDQYAPIFKASKVGEKYDKNKCYELLKRKGIKKTHEFDDEDSINHYVSRNYNITGPQLSMATACASGNNAIGEAFLRIKQGYIDIAIAGGAYNLDLKSMIGFTRLGALTANPDPETACRPFDKKRDGFVMGSGCGILIIESLESAVKRHANILGEIVGYSSLSDAYRSTDPDPEAKAATLTIKSCIEMAKVNINEIGYINAHGTSTKMNDLTETIAIKNVFGKEAYTIPVSSTKSMIGHSIMAAAAIEGIVCLKSINEGIIHPTRNWMERDADLDLDYVPEKPREVSIDYALSNSFGFGGQNSSVLFAKYKEEGKPINE